MQLLRGKNCPHPNLSVEGGFYAPFLSKKLFGNFPKQGHFEGGQKIEYSHALKNVTDIHNESCSSYDHTKYKLDKWCALSAHLNSESSYTSPTRRLIMNVKCRIMEIRVIKRRKT